jgi:hypothetical protein
MRIRPLACGWCTGAFGSHHVGPVGRVRLIVDVSHQQSAADQVSEGVRNFAVGFEIGLRVLLDGERDRLRRT